MEQDPKDYRLIEPASPEEWLPGFNWMLWTPLAIAAAFVLVVLLRLYLKSRPAKQPRAHPHVTAHADALRALNQCTPSSTREAATGASLILRRYLAEAANDPALYETHEEFVSRRDSLGSINAELQQEVNRVFARLATLKYAPETPAEVPAAILNEALGLLETLNREFSS